ncbi:hypothetical protein ZWY2020_030563 [Hordeum vulgare]|nr:hypothetical protein ZWY2020_030563 [Hordeum vulgare]
MLLAPAKMVRDLPAGPASAASANPFPPPFPSTTPAAVPVPVPVPVDPRSASAAEVTVGYNVRPGGRILRDLAFLSSLISVGFTGSFCATLNSPPAASQRRMCLERVVTELCNGAGVGTTPPWMLHSWSTAPTSAASASSTSCSTAPPPRPPAGSTPPTPRSSTSHFRGLHISACVARAGSVISKAPVRTPSMGPIKRKILFNT